MIHGLFYGTLAVIFYMTRLVRTKCFWSSPTEAPDRTQTGAPVVCVNYSITWDERARGCIPDIKWAEHLDP